MREREKGEEEDDDYEAEKSYGEWCGKWVEVEEQFVMKPLTDSEEVDRAYIYISQVWLTSEVFLEKRKRK